MKDYKAEKLNPEGGDCTINILKFIRNFSVNFNLDQQGKKKEDTLDQRWFYPFVSRIK